MVLGGCFDFVVGPGPVVGSGFSVVASGGGLDVGSEVGGATVGGGVDDVGLFVVGCGGAVVGTEGRLVSVGWDMVVGDWRGRY